MRTHTFSKHKQRTHARPFDSVISVNTPNTVYSLTICVHVIVVVGIVIGFAIVAGGVLLLYHSLAIFVFKIDLYSFR